LANHKGGIVFDDPVSSLDIGIGGRSHPASRRRQIRQVIILTHDTVFLADLIDPWRKRTFCT